MFSFWYLALFDATILINLLTYLLTYTLWYMYTANSVKSENCNIATRNRSLDCTAYMSYVFEALERELRFNFTYLGATER